MTHAIKVLDALEAVGLISDIKRHRDTNGVTTFNASGRLMCSSGNYGGRSYLSFIAQEEIDIIFAVHVLRNLGLHPSQKPKAVDVQVKYFKGLQDRA